MYPGGRVFIKVILQVNHPSLALIHFLEGNDGINVSVRVLFSVSVSLGLGLGAHLLQLWIRDNCLWLLCWPFISW